MFRRIVIKLGTSVLTRGTTRLDRAHMVDLVRQSAALHREGLDVILCSSGAIAAGREHLAFERSPDTVAVKQMLAAVGQSRLMMTWERLFELYEINVGQILLTRSDFETRGRFLNARDTLETLLAHRIVPIVNENDAVATAEIRMGDNDNLSASLVVLLEADLLLLLTDQPGLFSADPRIDPGAVLIPEVRKIDETLRGLAGRSISGLGVGGMATKVQAADTARRAGAEVVIASGQVRDVVTRVAVGDSVGTRFPALDTPLASRKRWILSMIPRGSLEVDEGAADAIREEGGSLLPAGIIAIDGAFARGDTVRILCSRGNSVAVGVARYDSREVREIMGRQSTEITERLGYGYGPVVVHRDEMILEEAEK